VRGKGLVTFGSFYVAEAALLTLHTVHTCVCVREVSRGHACLYEERCARGERVRTRICATLHTHGRLLSTRHSNGHSRERLPWLTSRTTHIVKPCLALESTLYITKRHNF